MLVVSSAKRNKPRWQRRKEARPDEILAAALELFTRYGYAATRLADVAARAGVSKGTLYLYFPNKAELFKALVRRALLPNLAEAEAQAARFCGSSRELLGQLVGQFARAVVDSPLSGIPKLVISEAGNFPEIARFYFEEVIQRVQRLVESILARGMRRGEFRRIDTALAWRVVVAPLVLQVLWKHSFQAYEGEPARLERYVAAHLDLLFHGLAKEPAA
jgi:AcrR family transcriptional regulator